MIITWIRDKGTASTNSYVPLEFTLTCSVRERRLHDRSEVVRTVTENRERGQPYMPLPFPKGRWEVTGTEDATDPLYAPVKILTGAHQSVEAWALDREGGYDHKAGFLTEDYGYWLHFCEVSKTTLGCGRIGSATEARRLSALVQEALGNRVKVWLNVI